MQTVEEWITEIEERMPMGKMLVEAFGKNTLRVLIHGIQTDARISEVKHFVEESRKLSAVLEQRTQQLHADVEAARSRKP